jgi:hypothetical protein
MAVERVRRDVTVHVRVSDVELAELDAAAVAADRTRSDMARLRLLGKARPDPVAAHTASQFDAKAETAAPPVAQSGGNLVAISDAGMAALDRLAEREGCDRDEIVRRVLKYGAWKMPPGYKG